jgi:hypothetical protein
MGKLVACTVSEAAFKSKWQSQKARADAIAKRLKVAEAEKQELNARLAAAHLEAAGTLEVCSFGGLLHMLLAVQICAGMAVIWCSPSSHEFGMAWGLA